MNIIIDPHVHIYPNYDLHTFLKRIITNFNLAYPYKSSDEFFAICLTERPECNYYQLLQTMSEYKPSLKNGYLQIVIESTPLFVFPGKQINTKEGLEVLGLLMEETLPQNTSLENLCEYISSKSGIPIINWAPGKWSGARGQILENKYPKLPHTVMLGYTKLLPRTYALPKLIQIDYKNRKPVLFGSDPLPILGEYSIAGSCGMILNNLDEISRTKVHNKLSNEVCETFGNRDTLLHVVIRLIKNELKRRFS